MRLVEVKIRNFRGIRSLDLPLDRTTVLIGENNTGKSTVLDAIRLVLTRGLGFRREGRFAEYDFHLQDGTTTPQTADRISITLHFAEEQLDEWPDAVVQQLGEVIQLDPQNGLNHIKLQAQGTYQAASGSFETKWAFLDNNGIDLPLKNATSHTIISRFVPLFLLSALRDASQEFGQRGQFWSGFLKSIELPDEQRRKIEEMLEEVNTSVIGANTRLQEVIRKIGNAGRLVPLDSANPVVLEAIPTRIFDMFGKIQVHLKSNRGVKLPLDRHGEGTQSLAVLLLFQAFVAANLAEAYAPESTPILALEEPEAHLHPSAIRSVGSSLNDMPGQVVVTSHSGDLVSRVPITALRRIYKKNGETHVGQVGTSIFTPREQQAIDYSIRLSKGHYLFSRCWLLVEGESDYHLMPLLFELMGHSLDQVSFSVVEFAQVKGKGEPFIKLAKALGIQWFLMADGDGAGADYVNRARNHLAPSESLADRAHALTQVDIEHEFWHNGYQSFIENMVPTNARNQAIVDAAGNIATQTKKLITAAIHVAEGKPGFAQVLVNEVRQRGASTIPQTIQDIIARVVQLATG